MPVEERMRRMGRCTTLRCAAPHSRGTEGQSPALPHATLCPHRGCAEPPLRGVPGRARGACLGLVSGSAGNARKKGAANNAERSAAARRRGTEPS